MCNRLFTLLIVLFLAVPISADENERSENIEALMVERYAVSMGKIARNKLAESGMAQSDVERIAAELSATVEACVVEAIEQQSAGRRPDSEQLGAVAENDVAKIADRDSSKAQDVEASEDKMELCVQTAFENAGIKFP